MIRYLLDTSICIDLLRGVSKAAARRLDLCDLDEVGLSAITLAELQHGAVKSSDPQRNLRAVCDFAAALEVFAFDDRAATAYGQVRGELERAGRPIGPLDTLIGSHALALGATLVTGNEREFSRVAGLGVENWTRPG